MLKYENDHKYRIDIQSLPHVLSISWGPIKFPVNPAWEILYLSY